MNKQYTFEECRSGERKRITSCLNKLLTIRRLGKTWRHRDSIDRVWRTKGAEKAGRIEAGGGGGSGQDQLIWFLQLTETFSLYGKSIKCSITIILCRPDDMVWVHWKVWWILSSVDTNGINRIIPRLLIIKVTIHWQSTLTTVCIVFS